MNYLVFLDLDDTLIRGQSQILLMNYLFQKKKVSVYFYLVVLSWFFLYKMRIVRDVQKISNIFFNICNGWNVEYMNGILQDFFETCLRSRIREDFLEIIKFHKSSGGKIILLTASIDPLAKIIKNYLKLDFCIATQLDCKDNIYSGKLRDKIIYGIQKRISILSYVNNNKSLLKGSFAYTDHISDFIFLNLIDNVFIVNPKKYFKKIIKYNNWNKIFMN